MTGIRPDFEEICAYVDGELDAVAAARIALAAARDGAVAAQIAQLTELKSLLPDAVLDGGGTDLEFRAPTVRRGLPRRFGAIAASSLLLGILAGWGAFAPSLSISGASEYEIALARHHDWALRGNVPTATGDPATRTAAIEQRFVAPDLSAAQLSLRVAETFERGAGVVRHFGYIGTRGCKLSLFVMFDGSSFSPGAQNPSGPRRAAWSNDGVGFLTIADGMDERHFETIVAVLRDFSIERAPIAQPSVDQLVASRSRSKPCIA